MKKNKLENLRNEVQRDKDILTQIRETENFWKGTFKIGLGCVGYLGLRIFVGPEIEVFNKDVAETVWDYLDVVGLTYGYIGAWGGGSAYGFSYLDRKSSEKSLKKSNSKLEKLMEK